MPTLAVGFCHVLIARAVAPEPINGGRHRLQMVRIAARSIAAKVVYLQALWDWPFRQLIGDPVDVLKAPISDAHFAIAVRKPVVC